jgi:hypothetical protein
MNTKFLFMLSAALLLSACAPVGSDAWCDNMGEKRKGDWTGDETSNYTKYCVLGMDPDKWCAKMEAKSKDDWSANDAEAYAKQCITLETDGD